MIAHTPAALIASAVVLALLALVALLEAAVTALARRRQRPELRTGTPGWVDRLAEEPRQLRRALAIARCSGLAAAFLVAASTAIGGAVLPALVALGGTALYVLLDKHGRLRRLGSSQAWLAPVGAAVLQPIAWLLPRRARATATDLDRSGDDEAALAEAFATSPAERQRMLQALVELGRITVDDIMVPRSDVVGIDLDDDWDDVLALLAVTPHTRLPLYQGSLDRIIGVVHMKRVTNALARGDLDRDTLLEIARQREAYFVPEGTPLSDQLAAFRQLRRRVAFVVDEYGDVQGLVTLEGLLEQVVGDFTTTPSALRRTIHAEPDGSYVVAGATAIRALNRQLGWQLPEDGPRTLNGLIVEQLETIPDPGTSLRLAGFAVDVLQTAGNAIRTVRIRPLPSASPDA